MPRRLPEAFVSGARWTPPAVASKSAAASPWVNLQTTSLGGPPPSPSPFPAPAPF